QIGKSSNMVTYGVQQVEMATNMGATDKLLVLDIFVREKKTQNIMNNVENMGGVVEIISSEHDAGKQLESLGSIAAFLRYPI
ncbi:MAG TPA: mRNA surveillance protein Pelota, partial [Methanosphaera sp.]|nr:mRNA surveillance protein Pelota [Methanosphaera sp.]